MGRGGVVDADTRTEAVTRESVGPSGAIPPTTQPIRRREKAQGKSVGQSRDDLISPRNVERGQISPPPPPLCFWLGTCRLKRASRWRQICTVGTSGKQ